MFDDMPDGMPPMEMIEMQGRLAAKLAKIHGDGVYSGMIAMQPNPINPDLEYAKLMVMWDNPETAHLVPDEFEGHEVEVIYIEDMPPELQMKFQISQIVNNFIGKQNQSNQSSEECDCPFCRARRKLEEQLNPKSKFNPETLFSNN